MPSFPRRFLRVVASIAALTLTPVAVLAQTEYLPVGIVSVTNAPLTLTSCKQYSSKYLDFGKLYAVVANRTMHGVLSIGVQVRYFDQDGTLIGQTSPTVAMNPPVAGSDTASLEFDASARLSEPQRAIVRSTCRVQSATFTGLKRWTYGQKWPEKLEPLPGAEKTSDTETAESRAVMPSKTTTSAPASRVKIAVTNSWNDVVNGVTYVHTALTISADDSALQVAPSNVLLSMALANGARKTYSAMTGSAPTYQKLNPRGSTTQTAYEVAPNEDFGRIGPVTVAPHADMHVVATFAIADALAVPTDNRTVSIK